MKLTIENFQNGDELVDQKVDNTRQNSNQRNKVAHCDSLFSIIGDWSHGSKEGPKTNEFKKG